jgi:O-antigen/teichoic acid export membrane protein
MSRSNFFKGLSLLLLLNALVKPAWIFGIDLQVQNIAGHEQYGHYFAVFSFTTLLSFMADAGLSNMMAQRIASGTSLNTAYLLRIKLILVACYVIACFAAARTWNMPYGPVLLYSIIIQALTSLFIFQRALITAHQLFRTDAVLSVVDKTAMIAVCGLLIYMPFVLGTLNLEIFLQCQVACLLLAVTGAAVVLYRHRMIHPGGSREELLVLFRSVLPFVLIILFMVLHQRADAFLLERLHVQGAYEAGIYASAFRLLDAGNIAGYLAASFLVPFIARHQADKIQLQQSVLGVRHLLLGFALASVAFCIIFASELIAWLYHESSSYQASVLRWCMSALPAYYLIHIYGSVLTATRRFRSFISIVSVFVLANIICNLVLLPTHGALGAAQVAAATQYGCALAMVYAVVHKVKLPLHALSIFIYAVGTLLLAGLFYAGKIALLPVWIILALCAAILLLLLVWQRDRIKKYLISLR